jgi:hypothetical protein
LFLKTLTAALVFSIAADAKAGSAFSADALERTQELLDMRLEDGSLNKNELLPMILVSATARYKDSDKWFATRVVNLLTHVFGTAGLRVCEACMSPRTYASEGRLELSSGAIGLAEIRRLDDIHRSTSKPARSALWLDETRHGVSLKLVDLQNAKIIFAKNIDPMLHEDKKSTTNFRLSEELERRLRGESLSHVFFDIVAYPGQHISFDWAEQWGSQNENFTGVSFSIIDPIAGLGAVYYRTLNFFNIMLGMKLILSIPTALARAVSSDSPDLIDPVVSGVFVLRVPFGASNYAAVLSASTNGAVGIGISLLNISLLPVLP